MLKQSQQFHGDASEPGAIRVRTISLRSAPSRQTQTRTSSLLITQFEHTDHGSLTWEHVAYQLSTSSEFRRQWNQTWVAMPHDFMWKPVPIHPSFARTYPFFCVTVPSTFPTADASAYREHLQALDAQIIWRYFPISPEMPL